MDSEHIIAVQLRSQRGFTLIAALFVIVICATMGVSMMISNRAQHIEGAREVLESQALQAAQAGIDWGLNQAFISASCPIYIIVTPSQWENRFQITIQCARVSSLGPPIIDEFRIKSRVELADPCSPSSNRICVERSLFASGSTTQGGGIKTPVFIRPLY